MDQFVFNRFFRGGIRRFVSLLLFCLCLSSSLSIALNTHAASKRPLILYYNSATPDNHWWRTSAEIMQRACDDLGMDLKVVYVNRNQIKMVNEFSATASGPDRPNAVVFQSLKQNGVEMLQIAEKNKIPAFIFNAGLTTEQTKQYGGPREQFKYWIGQMLPDDKAAGYELALLLYQEAVKLGLADRDGKVQIFGINGAVADGASIERAAGLTLAAQKEPRIILKQIVPANWQRDTGKDVFFGLSQRYPQAKVVWAANDLMGLGVLDGMIERKIAPGKEMLVGSIDWMPEALQEVNNNRMVTTIGGHFMETGWVAVLLHDYFKNKDFATEAVNFKSQMASLSKKTSADYLGQFRSDNFKKIDFRQFSKVEHPTLKQYDFNFKPVMKNLGEK
jgi:ABC-type sugar transport system substrate-binding protein